MTVIVGDIKNIGKRQVIRLIILIIMYKVKMTF